VAAGPVTAAGLPAGSATAAVPGVEPEAVFAGSAGEASAAARREAADFLSFAETAVDVTAERLPGTDRQAMTLVLLLHRVANTVVYDLESTVHRPAGWSWSAFRLLFTVWVAGPQEAGRAAGLTGMSRAAVSSLAKTLDAAGLVGRAPDKRDRRSVVLSLTKPGKKRLEAAFREHNRRESRWAGLLTPEELAVVNTLLARLARTAQTQDWISHRF
jgi:DNA-binding MarR family transcriptional regulator